MQLSEFLPEIYLEANGCPEAAMLNALVHALREFCDKSHVWQADSERISLFASINSYDLDLPYGAELARDGIMSVTQGGAPVAVKSRSEMPADWREASPSDTILAVIPSRRTFLTYPTPVSGGATPLLFEVALRPALGSTLCDSSLGDWSEGIVAGALSRLKAQPPGPDRPWVDHSMVDYYRGRFETAIGEAKVSVIRGHSTRALTIKHRRL